MKRIALSLLLLACSAHGALVTDLDILDLSLAEKGQFQFKVRSKANSVTDFFYLSFDTANAQNVNQLSYVLMKLVKGDQFKLDAEIQSFSPYPAGSFYTVSDIRFLARAPRHPNQVATPAKPKKK